MSKSNLAQVITLHVNNGASQKATPRAAIVSRENKFDRDYEITLRAQWIDCIGVFMMCSDERIDIVRRSQLGDLVALLAAEIDTLNESGTLENTASAHDPYEEIARRAKWLDSIGIFMMCADERITEERCAQLGGLMNYLAGGIAQLSENK